MQPNLPVLYDNIMFGLPSDFAREVFLWAVERPGEDRNCYRAEAFAREATHLVQTLRQMFENDDLLNFILARHANYRLGGNQHPTYKVKT